MKLGIKNRLKVLATGSIDEYIKAFVSGDDLPSTGMDPDTAMKYSAVSACVRVRAETFASVPMILYRKTSDGREAVTDLPLADIWHGSPNAEMSPYGFKETLMTNFDVSGNSVCERLVNKKGELVGLYPYRHDLVKIERDKETKRLVYVIGSGLDAKLLQRNQVLHVPNLSFDGVIGMSPISYAAASIRLGVSYENYGVNFYANAATPSGIFRTDRSLSDDAYTRLRKTLTDEHVGLKKAGVPMLLEEGLDWKQLTVNPIDAQLLESKYFQIEDIARIYRVPQHLIGLLEHATFSNIEFQSLNFAMYTMLPIFKRFEDNINSQLLTPDQRKAGYYSEFKMDGLLRGDAKSRAEAYATGRLNSWLSPNDIRKLENLPGIEGGDNYIQPLNYINITQADEYYSSQKNTQNTANVKFEMLAETIYKMIKDKEGQS